MGFMMLAEENLPFLAGFSFNYPWYMKLLSQPLRPSLQPRAKAFGSSCQIIHQNVSPFHLICKYLLKPSLKANQLQTHRWVLFEFA
jgi:hypothetical protein